LDILEKSTLISPSVDTGVMEIGITGCLAWWEVDVPNPSHLTYYSVGTNDKIQYVLWRESSCRPDEAREGGGARTYGSPIDLCGVLERNEEMMRGISEDAAVKTSGPVGRVKFGRWFYLMLFTVAEPVLSTQDFHHA
jgi:hypothetical protein